LATQEPRHDTDETIRDAFAEIERQLDAYKATLRGETNGRGGRSWVKYMNNATAE
jgi:hypothetical protein